MSEKQGSGADAEQGCMGDRCPREGQMTPTAPALLLGFPSGRWCYSVRQPWNWGG